MGLKAVPEVRRLRKELFNEAVETAKALPADVCKELVLEAFRDLSSSHAVTQQQAFEWLGTPEGSLWQVRTALQSRSQLSDETCADVFGKMTPAQWREFDDFQTEPFRMSMTEEQRLQSDLYRVLKALRPDITDEACAAVYSYLCEM